LGGSAQEYIAKLVDPYERSAKSNSTSASIHRVVKVTKAAVYHGFDRFDSGSVSAFLKSPMRANIPRIAQAPKKDKIVNGSIVRPDRKEQHGADMDEGHSQALERRNTRGNLKRLRVHEQQDGEDEEEGSMEAGGEDKEEGSMEAGMLLIQLSKVAKRIHGAT